MIDPLDIIAWGRYVFWADLQFRRYEAIPENIKSSKLLGIVAHWLAAEYVVLEGWKELGWHDARIDDMLARYPGHVDVLRRCRNAVYHFQRGLFDERIGKCLEDKDEELRWKGALHFEFQRFLLHFPYTCRGTREQQEELARSLEACIGWLSKKTLSARALRVQRQCLAFLKELEGDTSALAEKYRAEMNEQLTHVESLGIEPLLHELKRFKDTVPP